jgi:CheY-like chemotaxis protein
MDFTKTNNLLLENSSDMVAVHKLLKEATGAKGVDILHYNQEKDLYIDRVNGITVLGKYLDNRSILGSVMRSQMPYFCQNISKDPHYHTAIDNPFKIPLSNQIIIPVVQSGQTKGVLRLSELPKSFSENDYRNLCFILPTLRKIFVHSDKIKIERHGSIAQSQRLLSTIEKDFEELSSINSNPEIDKLIEISLKNLESLSAYFEANYSAKERIEEKLKRFKREKKSAKKAVKSKIYANVLIADDVHINVKILNAMLSEDAIIDQIKHAYDGIETMDIIERCKEAKENIHILFLDHHMPGKTGLEIAEELKEATGEEAKIIIVSITNDPEIIADNGHLYDYHIPKPFNKENIKSTMEKIRLEHLS